MKFRGQIKVPDVDHPAVGAMAEVEGSHFELFLSEGESLGRWSLADVRADRLISNAFSVQLGDEEVTFLADDPIDFAYRGVEHMANEWARYRSMTLPRRMLATGRSRKDSRASRIHELRQAMNENIAGTSVTAIPKAPDIRQSTRSLPGVGSAVERDLNPPPQAVEPEQPTVDQEMPAIPAPVPDEQALIEESGPVSAEPAPVAPADSAPPEESVFKDSVPWAKTDEEGVDGDASDGDASDVSEADSRTTQPVDEPIEVPTAQPVVDEVELPPSQPITEETTEPEPVEAVSEAPKDSDVSEAAPAPWLTPEITGKHAQDVEEDDDDADEAAVPVAEEPPTPEVAASEAAASEVAEPEVATPAEQVVAESLTEPALEPDDSVEEAASTSSSAGPEDEERYIVDLGAFESGDEDLDEGESERHSDVSPDREPALAAANAKGGIMGAVKSAFVRNKASHDHDFVTAPGGIGITRQICTECGHISIGVSDAE